MVVRVYPWLVSYMVAFLALVGVWRRVDAFIDCGCHAVTPPGLCVAFTHLGAWTNFHWLHVALDSFVSPLPIQGISGCCGCRNGLRWCVCAA